MSHGLKKQISERNDEVVLVLRVFFAARGVFVSQSVVDLNVSEKY